MGKVLGMLVAMFIVTGARANECTKILTKTTAYGQLRPDFVHTTHYDVDLPSPFGVKNQCATPFCHLYAWSADLENPAKVETSAEYVAAAYLLNSVTEALARGDIGFAAKLGSLPLNSIEAIRRSGLIPKEAWKGSADFNKTPNIQRLLASLQSVIVHAVTLRKATTNPSEQASINWAAQRQIEDLFHAFVGELPKSFEYGGEFHTPLTFADKYFPELKNPVITMAVHPNEKFNTLGQSDDKGLTLVGSIDETEKVARKLLDQGHPLWLSYFHRDQFVDLKTGVMSISAFNYPEMAAPEDRAMRNAFLLHSGAHAVLLVGYELDPVTGKVRKWKIQNSWGDRTGDQGIFHMYADYFRTYVQSITYLDDGKVAIPPHLRGENGRGFDEPKNLVQTAPKAATPRTP